MGLLNSALHVGRSAILGYEAALHVVGNNISSAASPDFTRLSPQLDPLQGPLLSRDLQPGAGVALTAIQRNLDEALETRIRLAIGAAASASAHQASLAQIETLFDDFGGVGLAQQLTQFFNAFDELHNNPEDVAVRDLVIAEGVRLADSIRRVRTELISFQQAVDSQITSLVDRANEIAAEIARLNEQITTSEAGRRGQATALRDRRDGSLRELSELFDVVVRHQPDGAVNVYVGNEALVQGSVVRKLSVVTETDLSAVAAAAQAGGSSTRASVRFLDPNQQMTIRGGMLEGLIRSRDVSVRFDSLDQLASALIAEVNRVHADGQGLTGHRAVTAAFDVAVTNVPLDAAAAGLPFPPQSGSFFIAVADDATGTPVAYEIPVRLEGTASDTTLESLVADLTATVNGVTASITADGRLRLNAQPGFSFTFGHDGQEARPDTSGVLAAVGINTFFSGRDASDIAVSDSLRQQPALLAAASVFLAGDGANAARIASLATASSQRLEGLSAVPNTAQAGMSLTDFYRTMAAGVAGESASVRETSQAAQAVLGSLQAQREAVSGVNLDEEAISLLKFERAYQGSARFLRTVNDLITELMSVIR